MSFLLEDDYDNKKDDDHDDDDDDVRDKDWNSEITKVEISRTGGIRGYTDHITLVNKELEGTKVGQYVLQVIDENKERLHPSEENRPNEEQPPCCDFIYEKLTIYYKNGRVLTTKNPYMNVDNIIKLFTKEKQKCK